MSALALLLFEQGNQVRGSDIKKYIFTEDEIRKKGIEIENINNMKIKSDEKIIIGLAMEEKYKKKYPNYISYTDMINYLSKDKISIAVAGTHGKTTTTKMLCHVLEDASYIIGDGEGKYTDSNLFIYEACEYKEHFLRYNPDIIVCTNIDYDHVDYYKSKEEYKEAFDKFFKKTDKVFIGTNEEKTNLLGRHIRKNAALVVNVCKSLGYKEEIIIEKLESFTMPNRRFDKKFINDCVIIDDYGHHPNEIIQNINAIKEEYQDKKLILCFKPDRISRILAFKNEFINIFNAVDKTYLFPFYEKGRKGRIIEKELGKENPNIKLKTKIKVYNNSVYLFTGSKMMNKEINRLENKIVCNKK